MLHIRLRPAILALVGLTVAGCAVSKSANPLTPTVAGPLPGVEISAPKPVNPTGGMLVAVDQQPVTLTVENASTNSQRTLSYGFEVATDAAFSNVVYSRDGVTPGESNTAVRLPDPLPSDRGYFWRSRAQDGANTGPYSGAANFTVVAPVVIGQPTLISPGPNALITSLRPRFVIGNAPHSASAGSIIYVIELSPTDSFATKAAWTVAEQPGQTTTDFTQDLAPSTYYFWHVRASDPGTNGPWSPTQALLTPVVPSGPAPGAGGSGSDAIDLSQAIIHNSPQDVATWARSSTVTRLDLMPTGAHIESTRQDAWPDFFPPGWSGPLQYTLWIALKINGQWHASGCIEYWRGLYEGGGPVDQYAQNWYFDPMRWGPMTGHQPAVGEQVGFFVTAGDARNNGTISVRERSNVVLVPFPPSSGGRFSF